MPLPIASPLPPFEGATDWLDGPFVRAAAHDLHLSGPCAIDNDHTLGDLFQICLRQP